LRIQRPNRLLEHLAVGLDPRAFEVCLCPCSRQLERAPLRFARPGDNT